MRKLAWWFCMFGMTAAAGALPPSVPPVSSDLSIGNGRAPSGGKTGFRADHGGALPGNGCVESGACRKTGIGREPFIFLLSVRDGGRGKEGGYDRTGGVRLPVSREIKGTAGRGALYPFGSRAGVAVHGGRENYIEKIFSELFEVYGRELLADYGKNGAAFQTVMARCQTTEAREKGVRRADGTL